MEDTDPLFEPPIGSFDPDILESSSNDDKPLLYRHKDVEHLPTNIHLLTSMLTPHQVPALRNTLYYTNLASACHAGAHDLQAESYMCSALQAEVNDISVTGEPADHFQPEPVHW